MGVRRLRSFIWKHEDKYLLKFNLQDTKLIIDGSNLLYVLHKHYETECKYGGNYDHFYTKCTEFFKTLLKCNVTPVVVFDGADDPKNMKLDTILKRLDDHFKKVEKWEKTEEVLPVLSKITLCQVLVDLNIAHMACIYEADREIAVLANKWNCPVLSDDSDFYVYSLNGGSISMLKVVESVPTDIAGNYHLPVKLYIRNIVLLEHFIIDHDEYDIMISVFATLVGNDYFDPSGMTLTSPVELSIRLEEERINQVVKWLDSARNKSGRTTLDQISRHIPDDKREQFEISVNLYLDINTFFAFDLEACYNDNNAHHREPEDIILKDRSGHELPFWFVRNAIECNMVCSFILNITQNHRLVFKAQAELIDLDSSFRCSEKVRRVIYSLVLNRRKKIEEYHRHSSKRKIVKPIKTLKGTGLPRLDTVPDLTESERKAIIFATFGARLAYFEEEDMDTSSQILILMLSLWKKDSKAPGYDLNALIIGMIALHIFSPTVPRHRQCPDILKAIDEIDKELISEFKTCMGEHFVADVDLDINTRKFIHNVSQFQAVYLHTYHLNQLLLSPVCIPSPSVILNSTFAYNMCQLLENNEEPSEILCGEKSPLYLLFTKWKNVVRQMQKTMIYSGGYGKIYDEEGNMYD